ncbi:MAG: hypothetical protein GX265_00855 [Mollicutes bacterium]|jgi:hypothetical protein|nr:hypothetical protein [Mollicutes bacterium]
MLTDLLNKEIKITYELGYYYNSKKGVVTEVTPEFIILDDNTMINREFIIKIEIK